MYEPDFDALDDYIEASRNAEEFSTWLDHHVLHAPNEERT